MLTAADRNTICNQAAYNLSCAIEAEPDVSSAALLAFGPPLRSYQHINQSQCDNRQELTCEVSRANPGVTAASDTPSINRMATAPLKL